MDIVTGQLASTLLEFKGDESWRLNAACLDADPDMFFPERGDYLGSDMAKRFCQERCEVRENCLETALKLEQGKPGRGFGVWGGLSPKERVRLYHKRERELQEAN